MEQVNEEKMDGRSMDLLRNNIDSLVKIFPDVVFNGKVDFDKLKNVLGERIEPSDERYNFTWKGKADAYNFSCTPSTGTLRPRRQRSVNWDSTRNIYIEGDNLEVLKLLQRSYFGKVKLIYIDPPYNTGSDFVYFDDYKDSMTNYLKATGQVDSSGNPFSTNRETSGRVHTDWLNMIYPRIKLAWNLLREDGVMFISIDDNEVSNLTKVCDEIFGEQNNVGTVIWERAFSPQNDSKTISTCHDYILVYAKSMSDFRIGLLQRTKEANERYTNQDNDPRGPWMSDNLTVKTYNEDYDYAITTPGGKVIRPTGGRCWSTSKERMDALIADNRIWFGSSGCNTPRLKRFLSEVQDGMVPKSIWARGDVGDNQEGSQQLKKLFDGNGYFDGPKPIKLIKRILKIGSVRDGDIVLDFFGGSSTTAHACMEYSKENNIQLRSITVQLPEKICEGSSAYINGYRTITDIGIDRLRRAGAAMSLGPQTTLDEPVDVGFRVFSLDSSNFKAWAPTSDLRGTLLQYEDSILSDSGRTELDLVYEIALKLGLDLSSSVVEEDGFYSVENGALMVCLCMVSDTSIAERMISRQKELGPYVWKVVFRDGGFVSDDVKMNTRETLRMAGLKEDSFHTL